MSCRVSVRVYVQFEYEERRIGFLSDLVQPEMIFTEITIHAQKMAVGVIYNFPLVFYSIFAAIHRNLPFVTSKREAFVSYLMI